MSAHYKANGKLLATGEYLVLQGATALVLPLKVGQVMTVTTDEKYRQHLIQWHANVLHKAWFSATINTEKWIVEKATDDTVAKRLVGILQEAGKMNPALYASGINHDVHTDTGFSMNWGFGSSAALIANIAKWAKVDPFALYARVSNGSGADLAASLAYGPVLYQMGEDSPLIKSVRFRPSFRDHIWFVYLGKKQNSRQSIDDFKTRKKATQTLIDRITRLSSLITEAEDLKALTEMMYEHENITAQLLGVTRIGKALFSDFNGEIKSLGAWGGDFAMAVSPADERHVQSYFAGKGLRTVFSFDRIILS